MKGRSGSEGKGACVCVCVCVCVCDGGECRTGNFHAFYLQFWELMNNLIRKLFFLFLSVLSSDAFALLKQKTLGTALVVELDCCIPET